MLICHCEVTVKVFGPFLNWVVCPLLLSFKTSLYILDNSPSSNVSFEIFFPSSNSLDIVFCRAEF